jgi:hypothetical protein
MLPAEHSKHSRRRLRTHPTSHELDRYTLTASDGSNRQEELTTVRQKALFPEMEEMPAESELRGFRYRDEILTEEEETVFVL